MSDNSSTAPLLPCTPARRREICIAAGKARARQFTSEYQRQVRSLQSSESCARRGRLAYQKAISLYGLAGAMHKQANWRRAHPNILERQVIAMLDSLGVQHTREVFIAGQWVDFCSEQHATVIEVDGDKWHHYSPLHDEDRLGMDALKQMALASAGYTVLRLTASAIKNGDALRLLTSHFSKPAQCDGT